MNKYTEIHLELTTKCNFRCPFCPIDQLTRPELSMPKGKAIEIIDEIAKEKLAKRIAYHLMGEPLLYEELNEVLEYAHSKGLYNRVVTNGSLLSDERFSSRLLFCDIVDISVRAVNQEEYQRVCRNDKAKFEDYIAGVRSLIDQRFEHPAKEFRLRLFLSEHTDEIMASLGLSVKPKANRNEIQYDDKLKILFEYCLDWKKQKSMYPVKYFGRCHEFDEGFSVLADGSITTCCWDSDGENVMGNIFRDGGIMKILSCDKALEFRRKFSKNRIPTEMCAKCLARPTVSRCMAYQCREALAAWLDKVDIGKR